MHGGAPSAFLANCHGYAALPAIGREGWAQAAARRSGTERGRAYSDRSARTGSMRVPRQAGAALAASATSTSADEQPASVGRSSAPTP